MVFREGTREHSTGADLDFSAPAGTNRHISFQSVSTRDEQQGRREDRDYAVRDDVGRFIKRHPDWKPIRSIGVVESSREAQGETAVERRLFVSSLPADAEPFARAVRDIGDRELVTLYA
jgi:hypothetical protein